MKKSSKSNMRTVVSPLSPILTGSLLIALILTWGDGRASAEVVGDGDTNNGSAGNSENDNVLFFDWTPPVDSILGDTKWSSSSSRTLENQSAGQPTNENSLNQFIFAKDKRSLYGILGLATKRPHKTAAEIQHFPPQDAFMSVRGKKSIPVPVVSPFQRTFSVVLPGYPLH